MLQNFNMFVCICILYANTVIHILHYDIQRKCLEFSKFFLNITDDKRFSDKQKKY